MTAPSDYAWLFLLTTTKRQFYLYANTSEERDIWIHEFANFCPAIKDTPINSVRDDVQDKIDPFMALEVQNLSRHYMEKMNFDKKAEYNPGPYEEHAPNESLETSKIEAPDPNMTVEEI